MFIGEFSCLIVFAIVHNVRKYNWRRRREQEAEGRLYDLEAEDEEEPHITKFNPLIFFPPACCDVIATSLVYIGLNLTTASSFQMLRGL